MASLERDVYDALMVVKVILLFSFIIFADVLLSVVPCSGD